MVVYDPMEFEQLDTLVVIASKPSLLRTSDEFSLPEYKASAKRSFDLLHTRLDISFNWEEEQVEGTAFLTLRPYFYPDSTVLLDAKGFVFHRIHFDKDTTSLAYSYDNQQVMIQLGRTFSKDTFFTLVIRYTATPFASGGSAAITSDKGLYFINPKGVDQEPQQIWTQGETEHNSRWFPTIDKPNERCTQEMRITVEDRFVTLSNGVLLNSTLLENGLRTDHWVMDEPHAPYLFMLAVGEYAVVRERWKDVELSYYVEPAYEPFAKDIFPHTPEMMSFFSEKLGIDYPWPKYAQVVVRDFVSGAMENTTAVTFNESVQRTSRELVDVLDNELVVAHELMHHWFGNLVTCESWANLTLNEGFANYSEYLWLEHKYGKEEAEYHLLNERNGYLFSSGFEMHPLIHFSYSDKEDMFDRHSYNKGGLVLHMLRHYVGEFAFWEALQYYLTKHAYSDVEAHELRLAFEEVTGEDLNWFFNQWFFEQGHPELNISYAYVPQEKMVQVTVEQTQNPDRMPAIFQMPAKICLFVEDEVVRRQITKQVWIDQRKQTFSFEMEREPALVVFDPDRVLLAERQEEKSSEAFAYQYFHASSFMDRYDAVQHFVQTEGPRAQSVLTAALKDASWVIRQLAVEHCPSTESNLDYVKKLAVEDPHLMVRTGALHRMMDLNDSACADVARTVIQKDPAYTAVLTAMDLLMRYAPQEVLDYAQKLENEPGELMRTAIESFYLESRNPTYLYFFDQHLDKVEGYYALSWFSNYVRLASFGDETIYRNTLQKLSEIALHADQSSWRRLSATRALNELHSLIHGKIKRAEATEKESLRKIDQELIDAIQTIKSTEQDPSLLEVYEDFPDPSSK